MILLTLTLASRHHFLPESPLTPNDCLVHQKIPKILRCSLEILCPSLLHFPTTEISLWINTYTCRSYFYSQLTLLLQDTLKSFLLIREYFVPTALQFLATWIPLRIISRPYRVSAHPQLFRCFTKVFKILFDPSKFPSSLLLCKHLSACIMDASHRSSNIR